MTGKTLFITSSGTEIGKTYVTVGLIGALRARGIGVRALKPLITEFTPQTAPGSDTALILKALGEPVNDATLAACSPWRYAAALAPDMAAAREGKTVPYDDVVAFCAAQRAANPNDVLIVEGAGGVLVPVDDTHTMRDLMVAVSATPIVVVGSYLGTISHTLTAVEALERSGLPPMAVVVSESPDAGIPLDETCAAIRRFLGPVPLVPLPRNTTAAFADLADLVLA